MGSKTENAPAKDQMDGCPVTFPKIDENELLADVRSPRFLLACRKLQIDPLELRSLTFDSFKGRGGSIEKQQVRFAMYERARFQKWKELNRCRYSLSGNGTEPMRSRSVEPVLSRSMVRNSWLGAELTKTAPIRQRGKTEVYMSVYKTLKDIANTGSQSLSQTSLLSQSTQSVGKDAKKEQDQRKEYLKKQAATLAKRKERAKQAREAEAEKVKALKEQEAAEQKRRNVLLESWKQEAEAKRKAQMEKSQLVQEKLKRAEQEKEEQAQKLLEEMHRKEESIRKKQEESRPLTSPSRLGPKSPDAQTAGAAAAAWRREQAALRQAEQAKQLMAEFKKQQSEFERKIAEKKEREKDQAKVRKSKEFEVRKKIAAIRKKAKEVLKEKVEKTREHLLQAEQKAAQQRENLKQALAIKAEIERLQFEQAQEKHQRQIAMQQREAAELALVHEQIAREKEERNQVLQQLLRERNYISTQVRLQKEKIQEEIVSIQKSKTWNRAAQLLQELQPISA